MTANTLADAVAEHQRLTTLNRDLLIALKRLDDAVMEHGSTAFDNPDLRKAAFKALNDAMVIGRAAIARAEAS